MKIKLRNATEIQMYFERKEKNIPESEIYKAILLLREIVKLQDKTKEVETT